MTGRLPQKAPLQFKWRSSRRSGWLVSRPMMLPVPICAEVLPASNANGMKTRDFAQAHSDRVPLSVEMALGPGVRETANSNCHFEAPGGQSIPPVAPGRRAFCFREFGVVPVWLATLGHSNLDACPRNLKKVE